ncbi:MAG: CRISPR-associated endonuclease Cas1 [Campylobacterales bacterium]|nr:CRISPR-associated endonuclease Cas1 [Campylobacterales bacterium]
MQKQDRSHFILNPGRLRRQDNNLYFDRYDEEGAVVGTKILPIHGIDELYVLGKVDVDSYTLAFLAQNNVLVHVFSPQQSFRGNFFPTSSNSVNKSGFVLLQQVRAFDEPIKRLYIAREITRAHFLNAAHNCHRYDTGFEASAHVEALDRAQDLGGVLAAEGAFQKAYYEQWNRIITDGRSFKFTVRSKRPPADKINCLISYMNTRMYNVCLSEIYKTELDPRIGFLHEPNYRSLSLHLDVAEVFKPLLGDPMIFAMLNKREITARDFKTDAGRIRFSNEAVQKIEMRIIGKLTEQVRIGEQYLTWRQVIRREANRLKRCICEDAPYEGLTAKALG